MDDADVEVMIDRLAELGVLRVEDDDVQPTRRWVAHLQAAAEKLNAVAAKTGRQPRGNPLVLAVTAALANQHLDLNDEDFETAVDLLVTLELSRMTPTKRIQHGFTDTDDAFAS